MLNLNVATCLRVRSGTYWRSLLAALLFSSTGQLSAQTYCPSDGGTGNTFNIARVQFAGVDNNSGDNNGYADFTGSVAQVDPGASYGIVVDPNGPFFLRYRWRAWIDWNNDGTFAASELVFQSVGFGQEAGSISVPADATAGTKRMRVNMSAFTYRGACQSYLTGEVEDYTVNVAEVCNAYAGTLQIDKPVICYEGGAIQVSADVETSPIVPAGYQVIYVLTEGSDLLISDVSATPDFNVSDAGSYTIHTLVYDPGTLDLSIVIPGVTTGFDVNALLIQGGGSICGALDVSGVAFSLLSPSAGTLSGGNDVCGSPAMLTATANGDANVPDGYLQAYVLTSGSELVIEQLGAEPMFEVTGGGLYTIHSFVYPEGLDLSIVVPGVTTGFDVNGLLVQGGGSVCASLDVAGAQFNVSDPSAGTLSGGSDVCGSPVMLNAITNGDANVPDGYLQAYVLTSGTGLVIEQLGAEPMFEVTGSGLYTIHSFVYPEGLDLSIVVPGVTTGFDVNGLLVQGGGDVCASLDVAGAQFNVTDPNAGTLSGGSDVCGSPALLSAAANGDANVPDGYAQAYVLTSGSGLVIEQLGAQPMFEVTGSGLYTIHSFVYPEGLDLSIVVPGVTTGFDVNGFLVQGGGDVCASLDVAGAQFNVTDPNAGTLSGGNDVCGSPAMLSATANGDANVPDGYLQAYVLTSGSELVIEQLGAEPMFEVTGGGLYTIHSFVYPEGLDLSIVVPGVTTGFDVNGLLVQGGGDVCASLDVAGAQFNVSAPSAETLSGGSNVCGSPAMLSATANGDANVPDGYLQAYVLTSGTGLVIEQLGAEPMFEVTGGGLYTIHSFVYPEGLDLSIVVPGVTTGFDVNGLLVQGGGSVCASLDVAGAQFNVTDPSAGTLSGGSDVCLEEGSAILSATPNGDANIPEGYTTAYVLTSGAGLVIEQLSAMPEFTVNSAGSYTIHTFIYPEGVDLSIVVPGVTTGFDVNGLLVQGGGELCASFDVAGAAFAVEDCEEECIAFAGTLMGGGDACLVDGSAFLSAMPNGDAVVPTGYTLAYVLTSGTGVVIEQLNSVPEFTVGNPGLYTIHAFVYPESLDLSIVVPGVTTGFDVNGLLIQGGGELCASLDVAGAKFMVEACEDECIANAGHIDPLEFIVCRTGGSAVLNGVPAGDAFEPLGYQTLYVLTRGTGLTIQQVNTAPTFTVTQLGLYRIHTLVYDPATLDLSMVQFGVTTGFDVNSLLIQGGGSICASLDVAGSPHLVVGPVLCIILHNIFGSQPIDPVTLRAADGSTVDTRMLMAIERDAVLAVNKLYPNPVRDILMVEVALEIDMQVEVAVLNAMGQEMLVPNVIQPGTGISQMTIDVNTLPSGTYYLRALAGDKVITERFMKMY